MPASSHTEPLRGRGSGHAPLDGMHEKCPVTSSGRGMPPPPPQPMPHPQKPSGYTHVTKGHVLGAASTAFASAHVAGHAPPESSHGQPPPSNSRLHAHAGPCQRGL